MTLEGQHRLVLVGPQGSGKGTQGELLQVYLQIPTISTGQLCRAEIEKQTEHGREIAEAVAAGELVADSMITAMLKERISEYDAAEGFIIDGFPRTVTQARESLVWLAPTRVIVFELDDSVAVERMSARRACEKCRYKITATYVAAHGDTCPRCFSKLVRRADDNPSAIKKRLAGYRAGAQPVIDFYEEHKLAQKFNASLSIPLIFMEIAHAL